MPTTFPAVDVNFVAGVRNTSPAVTIPSGTTAAQIQVVTATATWTALSGTLAWGCEWSHDGGTTWHFAFGQDAAIGGNSMVLGSLDRSGKPPTIGGTLSPAVAGDLVRLYGTCSITATIRIQVTTFP